MDFLLKLAFLFFVGSVIGWGIEVLYRKFFSGSNPEHRWVNPGFLIGPWLPLYGFSLCVLYLLAGCERFLPIVDPGLRKAVLFLVMAACVTGVEYLAGLIFIKGMHVQLWDYSKLWGNVNGIICPLFSFFWMLLSATYYFLIHPHILNWLAWLANNLAFSFFIGLFFGFFLVDFVASARLISKIRAFANENGIVVRYEELKAHIRQSKEQAREKARFALSMYSHTPLAKHLAAYSEKLKSDTDAAVKRRRPHEDAQSNVH